MRNISQKFKFLHGYTDFNLSFFFFFLLKHIVFVQVSKQTKMYILHNMYYVKASLNDKDTYKARFETELVHRTQPVKFLPCSAR